MLSLSFVAGDVQKSLLVLLLHVASLFPYGEQNNFYRRSPIWYRMPANATQYHAGTHVDAYRGFCRRRRQQVFENDRYEIMQRCILT